MRPPREAPGRLRQLRCLLSARVGALVRPRPHLLLACMPKSGSTFLATTLAQYPGLQSVSLVPACGHREQELCEIRLAKCHHRAYVAQHHVRNSAWTQQLIGRFGLTPLVLVRDLADVVVSLRDHVRNESCDASFCFLTERHRQLNDADLEEAIARLAMPWYLNFYAGWKTDPAATFIRYETLVAAPAATMAGILATGGIAPHALRIEQALTRSRALSVRFNIGTPGRGRRLAPEARRLVLQVLDQYPELRDDPYILDNRAQLRPAQPTPTVRPRSVPALR